MARFALVSFPSLVSGVPLPLPRLAPETRLPLAAAPRCCAEPEYRLLSSCALFLALPIALTTTHIPTVSDRPTMAQSLETRPLLAPHRSEVINFSLLLKREVRAVGRLMPSISATTVCRLLVFSVDASFLGHLGTKELAGASLAQVIMMIAMVFIYGAASNLSSLGSQALGANNPSLLVGMIEKDAEVLHYVREYSIMSILTIIPMTLFACVRQYFQVQGFVLPATVVSLLALGVNFGFNQLFIYGVGDWEGFGFKGSPMATAATATFQLVAYCIYMFGVRKYHKATWPGLHLSNFSWDRMTLFLRESGFCGLALLFDESAFQSLVLMAGSFTETDVAAQGAMFQIFNLGWAMWWGIGLATQIRIGENLGANRPRRAQAAACAGMLASVVLVVVLGILIIVLRDYLAMPFSKDEAVIALTAKIAPYSVAAYAAYVFTATLGSLMEGMSRMMLLSAIMLVFAYGAMIPACYELAYVHHMKLPGLWLGCIAGDALKLITMVVIVLFFTNWRREAHKARDRSEALDDDSGIVRHEDAPASHVSVQARQADEDVEQDVFDVDIATNA
ncbi:uncharacterized protein MONBRDRAFT_25028 [Monosiga brevicollis MX1]|uniref:Multidrug and toxin extrusion protein n=1 Tax=Monosiga brevicollis TaxID=81824 RepID=A9UXK0_MONBE|nr:uncharacterized protein MONBRDRAFT_25028 [Monosiga brevicollis MX1]EDQ90023.1 predicted protein [Monosiga brevicollis MX1]|eukprot:XP_001745445.1 hypothetical protein [Monosiga brevicollis MX1]